MRSRFTPVAPLLLLVIVPVALAASPTSSPSVSSGPQSFTTYSNSDCTGLGDIVPPSPIYGLATQAACEAQCTSVGTACLAYAYRPGAPNDCWIKSSLTGVSSSTGQVCAVRRTCNIQSNCDYFGNDIINYPSIATPNQCCDLCQQYGPTCVAWALATDGTCYLKNAAGSQSVNPGEYCATVTLPSPSKSSTPSATPSVTPSASPVSVTPTRSVTPSNSLSSSVTPTISPSQSFVSKAFVIYTDSDCNANDIIPPSPITTGIANPTDCMNQCLSYGTGCVAWEYVPPNSCWIKNAVAPITAQTGQTCGVRRTPSTVTQTCTVDHDCDYTFNDLANYTGIATPSACCDLCAAYPGCIAWALTTLNQCYVKHTVAPKTFSAGEYCGTIPASVSPTSTSTPSVTPSPTRSVTPTPSVSPTCSVTPTSTATPSSSATPSQTPTPTSTPTPSVTPTGSVTPTPSVTPTATVTPTASASPGLTPTASASISESPAPSITASASAAPSTSASPVPPQGFVAPVPGPSGGTPWWVWLLVAIAILLLCVAVALVALIWYRRRKERVKDAITDAIIGMHEVTPDETGKTFVLAPLRDAPPAPATGGAGGGEVVTVEMVGVDVPPEFL